MSLSCSPEADTFGVPSQFTIPFGGLEGSTLFLTHLNQNIMKANVALLLTFILGLTFQLTAQYDLLYENHEQNPLNVPRVVADDGQGNTWLAGYFTGSLTLGAITLTNNATYGQSSQTGFIGKFNSNSNTWLWAKKIERASTSSGQLNVSAIQDIALDNAGNVYLTGYYQGIVRFDNLSLTSTKQGQQYTRDIFVAKYNASGGIVWAKSFGSKNGTDRANAIVLDGSGNIFIGGSFTNVHKHFNVCGGEGGVDVYDVYLAKLNNAGTALWQKRYASTGIPCETYNAGYDLSVDASGNVCMVGEFSGTVSFGTSSALSISSVSSSIDAFVAKVNGSGTTQWVNGIGTNSRDYGNAIHADASGNVYGGGKVATDAFLSKYNASGNQLWSVNPYPASPAVPQNSVNRINPQAGSILVNDAFVGFKTISPADGSVMTSDSLIGNVSFQIRDTEIAGSGFIFSVRSSCGEVTIGGTALTSANACPFNGDNFFLVRNGSEGPPPFQAGNVITDPLASFQEVAGNEIEIYPNPASDQLHVTIPQHEKETTLFIQNQYGQSVWAEKFGPDTRSATISLSGQHIQSGIYSLILLSNNEVHAKRLIIER